MIFYEIGLGLSIISVVLPYGTLYCRRCVCRAGRSCGSDSYQRAGGSACKPVAVPDAAHGRNTDSQSLCRSICRGRSRVGSRDTSPSSRAAAAVFMMTASGVWPKLAGRGITGSRCSFSLMRCRDSIATLFHFPGGAHPRAAASTAGRRIPARSPSMIKTIASLAAILIRWTLPLFRDDQLMVGLGWKGLVPVFGGSAWANVVVNRDRRGSGPLGGALN